VAAILKSAMEVLVGDETGLCYLGEGAEQRRSSLLVSNRCCGGFILAIDSQTTAKFCGRLSSMAESFSSPPLSRLVATNLHSASLVTVMTLSK
jgi:hypothetical protein